jgi:2-haloacid dehalogenase
VVRSEGSGEVAGALAFDVNETLLDMRALRGRFAGAFGDASALGEWFASLLHGSLVATVTDTYVDFGTIGRRELNALAIRRDTGLTDAQRGEILGTFRRLPPHPEVRGALERLHAAGFPMAALTNSTSEVAQAQLEHAGLLDSFDHVLSVEEVRRFKPAPEPYRMAAERLGVEPSDLRLVTAHDWDVLGAMRAGCAAAFVQRSGLPYALGDPPDIAGPDLAAVAERILEVDGRSPQPSPPKP